MKSKPFSSILARLFGQVPLQVVLVIPFVLQIVAAVGTVGYLSAQNGQRAVNNLADQLLTEISHRIEQNLRTYIATPNAINQQNYHMLQLKMLSLQNLEPWGQYLLRQVQIYPSNILYIGVGNTQGEYRSGEQLDDASLRLNIAQDTFGFRSYVVNENGQILRLEEEIPKFRLRQRQEYQSIARAKGPIWTPIYTSLLQPTLLIAKAVPILDQAQQFQGFTIAALRLDGVGKFLSQLEVSKSGQAFVIDRQGQLLATSTIERPFRDRQGSRTLIQATDSTNPITRAIAHHLMQVSQAVQPDYTLQRTKLTINRMPYYLLALPFQDKDGLDWLIVVVIPESDFMAKIHANNRVTLLLCLGSAMLAILLGILAAKWITKPLLKLNAAAKKIAEGNWSQPIAMHRQDEVGELANSFNQMSQQLQHSFAEMETLNQELTASKDQLASYNRRLKQQIADRTAALERVNQELERLATTDSLTQLANRRRFDEYLAEQWLHAIRSQSPLSLILCDVDYFKRYNDFYGHQMGDECLKQVAEAISSALQRSTDLATRYGGEEFGIILPYSDQEGAVLVAQSIQMKIRHLQCPHAQSMISPYITLSLGIASTLPAQLLSPKSLVAVADAALYEAKTQGRNRYCLRELVRKED